MKLVKTANGKTKIKMSRNEWIRIGKKSGWLKSAGLFDSHNEPVRSRGGASPDSIVHYEVEGYKSDVWKGKTEASMICGNGDWSVKYTKEPELVTCPECISKMKSSGVEMSERETPKGTCPSCDQDTPCPYCSGTPMMNCPKCWKKIPCEHCGGEK